MAPFKAGIQNFFLNNYYGLLSHNFFCFNSEYPSKTACKIRKQAGKTNTRFPARCTTQPMHSSQSRKHCFSSFCLYLEVREMALLESLPVTRWGFPGAALHQQPPAPSHKARQGGRGGWGALGIPSCRFHGYTS